MNVLKTEKPNHLEAAGIDDRRPGDELKADAAHILKADPKVEERILRKCDLHILPWLFGIWLCAFIDRSNIGNARIDGLTQDLRLQGTQFNTALGKFGHCS